MLMFLPLLNNEEMKCCCIKKNLKPPKNAHNRQKLLEVDWRLSQAFSEWICRSSEREPSSVLQVLCEFLPLEGHIKVHKLTLN